ncbi:hypothetical protein GCM10017566_28200 [Amycolatopsis bartoniae]|uniref:Uncharacterized protein n=1 Tax=Amycolatopsis bartoniae TaxID=941986 RepID=A0A8H9IXH8_9PSEU|nr:hypothetical protein GCM10017566_28200 [Amycolatopsis bartoniae]
MITQLGSISEPLQPPPRTPPSSVGMSFELSFALNGRITAGFGAAVVLSPAGTSALAPVAAGRDTACSLAVPA